MLFFSAYKRDPEQTRGAVLFFLYTSEYRRFEHTYLVVQKDVSQAETDLNSSASPKGRITAQLGPSRHRHTEMP